MHLRQYPKLEDASEISKSPRPTEVSRGRGGSRVSDVAVEVFSRVVGGTRPCKTNDEARVQTYVAGLPSSPPEPHRRQYIYIYIYICMYVYIYIYTYMYVYTYIYVHMYMCACIYTHIYIYTLYIHKYTHTCTCTC